MLIHQAEYLTTAWVANIERALKLHGGSASALARKAWPDKSPAGADETLRRMRRGDSLSPANLSALALALGITCDSLTSTQTPAAVAAREEQL